MEQFETLLLMQGENLQYICFFGAMVLLGIGEVLMPGYLQSGARFTRWPTNIGLTIINIFVLGLIPLSGIAAAFQAKEVNFGLINIWAVPPLIAFILTLFLRSLLSWVIHFLMHKVPIFWRVHRIHHTDTQMDISTTVRFHPAEFLISTPILVGAIMLLGLSPTGLILYEIIDAGMAVFTHANIRMPRWLDYFLRLVVVTPDMHRAHHSSDQPETDSNYGVTLSIWDRLFGTYRFKSAEDLGKMQMGLAECQDKRPRSLSWLLMLPISAKITKLASNIKNPAT